MTYMNCGEPNSDDYLKGMAPLLRQSGTGPTAAVHRFHFVLLPGFPMLSLTAALETLQNANLCSGRPLFDWLLCGLDAKPVTTSIGMLAEVSHTLATCGQPSDIVIVSGAGIEKLDSRKLCVWLSRHARGGVRVTTLGTAAYILAEAGLLRDALVTLHWQYRDSFRENYPDVRLSDRPHVVHPARCSSSGGVSSVDLFLELIAQDHGAKLSGAVAEIMNYSTIHEVQKGASVDAPVLSRFRNSKLTDAVWNMEQNLENPLHSSELACLAGISTRQLERLFRRHLNVAPKQYYRRLRLRRAYFLLTQTRMSILEVGVACGFQTASHFSKCFRAEYSKSPAQLRRTI